MPATRVAIYCEEDGFSPFLDWFGDLPDGAKDKVMVRLLRLRELGHELRRPEADYLRDGIYELRASVRGVHYRVLYFFHGRIAAVVAHGIVKEQRIADRDIEVAIQRKLRFESAPLKHTRREL
jgi:phage-related protein